jgi:hypothetical protein
MTIEVFTMKKLHCGFKLLRSDIHFYTAALDGSKVLVFSGTELIGGGHITQLNDTSVHIRDKQFERQTFTFVYAKG